jgi:hypothetical protein
MGLFTRVTGTKTSRVGGGGKRHTVKYGDKTAIDYTYRKGGGAKVTKHKGGKSTEHTTRRGLFGRPIVGKKK